MRNHIARLMLAVGAIAIGACEPGPPAGCLNKGASGDLRITLCQDPPFPYAREEIRYRAIVRDKDSGEPIESGEGQIYATSKDGVNRYDALVPGEELGTYYGELSFVTSGTWGVAIRFRRDTNSTTPIYVWDWQQDVRPSREPAFPGDTAR